MRTRITQEELRIKIEENGVYETVGTSAGARAKRRKHEKGFENEIRDLENKPLAKQVYIRLGEERKGTESVV